MLCLSGFELYSRWVPLLKLPYQIFFCVCSDVAGYLVPMEQRSSVLPSTPVETLPPSTENTAIYSEANSPPPQDKVKTKDYDYAKQDDVCVIRSSLENWMKIKQTKERQAMLIVENTVIVTRLTPRRLFMLWLNWPTQEDCPLMRRPRQKMNWMLILYQSMLKFYLMWVQRVEIL